MTTEIDAEGLLPCPLCGAAFLIAQEPHDNGFVAGQWYIYHEYGPLGSDARNCPIDVPRHFDSRAEAIAAWNRRASTSASEAEPVATELEPSNGIVFPERHTTIVMAEPVAPELSGFAYGVANRFDPHGRHVVEVDYTLPTPASDDQVEAVAMLALIKEEAAKDNAPYGRSDSMALDRIRSVLGLPSGGALAAMGSTKP